MTKSKHWVVLIIGVLCLLVAAGIIAVVALSQSNIEEQFPMWKEEVSADESNENIRLELIGIDFNVADGDSTVDEVQVSLENISDKDTAYGDGIHVDYEYNGTWYRVYRTASKAVIMMIAPGGKQQLSFQVPAGLFSQKGQYRIYVNKAGCCDIDMMLAPYQ